MDVKNLEKIAYSDQLVLTTEQLAEFYECDIANIKVNFNSNKDRFEVGKHYFKLEGDDLKNFKSQVSQTYLPINKFASSLYLWTKRGAARHAKMLSTEKAWEVFELLEDNYFNAKEKSEPKVENEIELPNQPPVLHKLLADINKSSKELEAMFGVKSGIAIAKSISVVERIHKIELPEIKELIPPADHEIGYLTPTQIGKKIGKSAQYVNKKLVELGLQEKNSNGVYILTDKGKNYGEAMPFEKNTHAGYQIKWQLETLSLVK